MNLSEKIFFGLYEQVYSKIPYSFGVRVRNKILKRKLGLLGRGVRISNNVKILGMEKVFLSDFVRIANKAIIDGKAGIKIGQYTMVGFESILLSKTHRHDMKNIPYTLQGSFGKSIEIGKNVWIGTRVIILPGVNIGDNCIIGANSVITKSFPDNKIIAGNPAKIIKEIEK